MAYQESLDVLQKYNTFIKKYTTLLNKPPTVSDIPALQKLTTEADTIKGQLITTELKNNIDVIKSSCQILINDLKEVANLTESYRVRTQNIEGRCVQFYITYREYFIVKKLFNVLERTKTQTKMEQLIIENKWQGLGVNVFLDNLLDPVIPLSYTNLRLKDRVIDKIDHLKKEHIKKLIQYLSSPGETLPSSTQLQNRLNKLKEISLKYTLDLTGLQEKLDQSTNQEVRKKLEESITQKTKESEKTVQDVSKKEESLNKSPGTDTNNFEARRAVQVKQARASEINIDLQIQDITPSISVVTSASLSGQNPLANLFGETQLLEGDILDPRKIDFHIPSYYTDKLPAFMSVIYDSTEALSSGVTTLPTIEAPFQAGPDRKVYNQFFLTRTYESYNEKQQLVDTMSEGNVAFFFGKAPEVWTFSGQLLNDKLHAWHAKMREIWNSTLRGSILVKNKGFLSVVVPSNMLQINCYPIALNIEHNTGAESLSMFSMSVIIKNTRTLPGLASRTSTSNSEKLSPYETQLKIADYLNKLHKGVA